MKTIMSRIPSFINFRYFAFFFIISGCQSSNYSLISNSTKMEHQANIKPPEFHHEKIDPSLPLMINNKISISIEQAILLMLKNNQELQVEQLSPLITGTFENIERAEFDPEFYMDFSYEDERLTEISRSTSSQFDTEANAYDSALGLRQSLATGTEIQLSIEQNRNISNRTPEQQTARIGLSMTQSLLKGFSSHVNLAKIKQAQLDTVASQYELRGFVEALISQTEITYWQFILAKKNIIIYEESLSVAKKQYYDITQRVEVGSLPHNETLAAQTEIARREQALIDAKSNLEEKRLRLSRLINPVNMNSFNMQIEPLSLPEMKTKPILDIVQHINLAEKLRPDLNEAKLLLEKNELETMITKNGLLPRLDLFISLGRSGFSDTIQNSFQQIDGPTYDWTAGFKFSYFLGNRANHARHHAAKLDQQKARKSIDNLIQLIHQEVLLAINELERTRLQIVASSQTRKLQELTVQAEKEKFDVGSSTSLQLAQSQRDLLESQIEEIEAVINYRIRLVELYLAEGSLLERRGIKLFLD